MGTHSSKTSNMLERVVPVISRKIGPVPKGPLSRDIHVLLIVMLGRLGAAITGDNAPRAVEEGLSIDEQGKRTTSVVHRSMTATDACSSLCAQNLTAATAPFPRRRFSTRRQSKSIELYLTLSS